jgi:hypothetical protein
MIWLKNYLCGIKQQSLAQKMMIDFYFWCLAPFIIFDLTQPGLKPRSTTPEVSTLTITQPMQLNCLRRSGWLLILKQ